jgi:hypothetical protein
VINIWNKKLKTPGNTRGFWFCSEGGSISGKKLRRNLFFALRVSFLALYCRSNLRTYFTSPFTEGFNLLQKRILLGEVERGT